jgi:hypothetical protein
MLQLAAERCLRIRIVPGVVYRLTNACAGSIAHHHAGAIIYWAGALRLSWAKRTPRIACEHAWHLSGTYDAAESRVVVRHQEDYEEAWRIALVDWISAGVGVGVQAADQADRIALDIPTDRRIVVPEVVVVFRRVMQLVVSATPPGCRVLDEASMPLPW